MNLYNEKSMSEAGATQLSQQKSQMQTLSKKSIMRGTSPDKKVKPRPLLISTTEEDAQKIRTVSPAGRS